MRKGVGDTVVMGSAAESQAGGGQEGDWAKERGHREGEVGKKEDQPGG